MADFVTIEGRGQQNKTAEALREVKKNLDAIMEFITLQAKLRRHAYEAHIEAGFSPEEALQLSKQIFG